MQEIHSEIPSFQKIVSVLILGISGVFGCIDYPKAAENLPQVTILPLEQAKEAAAASLAKCEKDGYQVSVAVVDRGGNLKVLLRGDGAGPHTTDSSTRKAYTSASLRRSTMELAALIHKIPTIEGLRDMNEKILILGGGLPVAISGEVLGGIGVGGAPGGHLDEACAREGLKAIGALGSSTEK